MEKLANVAFYVFAFFAFTSTLVVLISRETKHYILGAIAAFSSIAGFYLLIKSPVMFILQILFFATGTGALLVYLSKEVKNEEKPLINLNLATILSPFVMAILILILIPFISNSVNAGEIYALSSSNFTSSFIDKFNINILLASIMAISAFAGFYTIAFWRRR